MLVMPANVNFELTNTPDADAGIYREISIEIVAQVSASLQAKYPHLSSTWGLGAFHATGPSVAVMTHATLDALCHFCGGVLVADVHASVLRHRLDEVLLSLALQTTAPWLTQHDDVVLAVRRCVRTAIDGEVRLSAVGKTLGMSVATLRRRLAERGTNLRELLRSDRMAIGRALLPEGRLNVAEIAVQCSRIGARSNVTPSKLTRRFAHGDEKLPSELRSRRVAAWIAAMYAARDIRRRR